MRAVTLNVTWDPSAWLATVKVRSYDGESWQDVLDREVFDQTGLAIAIAKAQVELESSCGLPAWE